MMLTDEGASVTFCSCLEALYTEGMSSRKICSEPPLCEVAGISSWAAVIAGAHKSARQAAKRIVTCCDQNDCDVAALTLWAYQSKSWSCMLTSPPNLQFASRPKL